MYIYNKKCNYTLEIKYRHTYKVINILDLSTIYFNSTKLNKINITEIKRSKYFFTQLLKL